LRGRFFWRCGEPEATRARQPDLSELEEDCDLALAVSCLGWLCFRAPIVWASGGGQLKAAYGVRPVSHSCCETRRKKRVKICRAQELRGEPCLSTCMRHENRWWKQTVP